MGLSEIKSANHPAAPIGIILTQISVGTRQGALKENPFLLLRISLPVNFADLIRGNGKIGIHGQVIDLFCV